LAARFLACVIKVSTLESYSGHKQMVGQVALTCAALPGHMHGVAIACRLTVQAQMRHEDRYIVLVAIAIPLPASQTI